MELIGPDCETQKAGWTADLRREDAELVGNVIIHRSTSRSGNALRIGGDLNGRNQGRTRLVNNTILLDRSGTANAVLVQLGQGSLEMHNNVVYQPAAGSAPSIVRENPASNVDVPYCGPQSREPWSGGRLVAGSNNWVQSAAAMVPSEWTGTVRGTDPMFTDLAQRNFRPRTGSPLLNAGNNTPATPTAFPFPTPQVLPAFDPPLRAKLAPGDAHTRLLLENRIDIGAFEQFDIDTVSDPIQVNGSQPLIPSRPAGTAAPVTASQPAVVAPVSAVRPAVRERPRWRQAPAARYRRGFVRR